MPRNDTTSAANAEVLAAIHDLKASLTASRIPFPWPRPGDPAPDFGRDWGRWHPYLRGPIADPAPPYGTFRGPVADPGPEFRRGNYEAASAILRGPVADPGPELLLDRSRLIKLNIKKLELLEKDLERQLDLVRTEHELLKEELKASK